MEQKKALSLFKLAKYNVGSETFRIVIEKLT